MSSSGGSRRNVGARESDSSGASRRSDEPAGRRMSAHKLSPKGGAGNSVKLADETKDKQASSERQQQHQQQQIESQSAQSQANKLVFGLNPRAHRPQQRSTSKSGTIEQAGLEQNNQASDCVIPKPIEPITSQFINNLGSAKTSQRPVGQVDAPAKRSSQVRASKYGNFYKPQDLTATTAAASPTTTTTTTTPTTSANNKVDNKANNGQATTLTSSSSKTTMIKSSSDDQKKGQTRKGGKQQANRSAANEQDQAKEATSANERPTKGGGNVRPSSVRSTSKSPERSKQMARRKSFDEDISTIKTESSPIAVQHQQQPILKTRTQFNILPPPQLAIATTGKGSVVGYAKSRIYDRPVKQILANPPESTYSALDDRSGQIPASILSGFKPPKQVNVSKAREKWEGGEPFAKCKSRRRLAAQANKKLFPGTWSMTSVVATQQLHLQQALAQSASSANHRSNPLDTDPSVKVLTRGSVLERVQQFEKVPSSSDAGRVGDGLDGVTSGSSLDSMLFDYEPTSQTSTGSSLSRSSSSSSTTSSLGSDGGVTVGQQQIDSASKQAQYKSQVSSIQQQQQRSASTNVISAISPSSAVTPLALTGQPAPIAVPAQQRRLSLRRRSSLGLGRSSTESLIPKFYHPNGKPNTYEIEIQKRNIVACFDKFPERKAQTGTSNPVGRKQFHKIALACGYSEYFKVPLQRFIVHKLETDPKLAQMMSASNQAAMRQRKSSTIALNTNGTSSTTSSLRLLVKAASVDSSTLASPSAATDSSSSPLASANDKKEPDVNYVSCDQFLACWRDLISQAYDNAAQFIHLLTLGQRNYLTPDDFVPLVQSIIDDHPGLKFLRAAPDFHMRYIQTVIARIYFNVNRSWTGKITLQELRKSNLLAVLQVLGQEEDINQITDYFSYEHFYVIYCKFWNLDQDHDLFISKEDLARHNDAAISSRIIERIFSGIVSKQIQKTGRMSYSDFVWFLIAEEDKKHPRSVEYWFRIMDLDGDGYISMYEMEYFYYEQTKRLELMNIEALPFLDSACQILDLVNPREKNKISLADLKRNKMATIFFDTFINLEKYLEHESREFVSTRDVVQGGVVISDWDRYASEEYENLVTEESSV